MSVPTLTSITPAIGHTGGRTLVEIQGTNFALPPSPAPADAPLPDPAASVAILFGGEPADPAYIQVVSTTLIRCLTPIHDPAGASQTTQGATPDLPAVPIPAASLTVQNLDAGGIAISGEVATLPSAFSFVRPNLSTPGLTARVVKAFIQELKRQVVAEVDFNPHTDFDAETGDAYNICKFARVPAIAIVDLQLPRAQGVGLTTAPITVRLPDGNFVLRRAPDYRDLVFTLVCASNSQLELLSLEEAVSQFFAKNGELAVYRDPMNLSLGKYGFTMTQDRTQPVQFSGRQGLDNIVAFTTRANIQAVPRNDIPGLPDDTIPAAEAANVHAEATIGYGKTLDTFNLTRQQKPI